MQVKSSDTGGVNALGEQEKEGFIEEYWADEYSEAYADEDEW
jgi:hypothetical protein